MATEEVEEAPEPRAATVKRTVRTIVGNRPETRAQRTATVVLMTAAVASTAAWQPAAAVGAAMIVLLARLL